MRSILPEKYWHAFFESGIFLKGFNGVWEILAGTLFLTLNRDTLHTWYSIVTHHELLQDPNDPFLQFLSHVIQNTTVGTQKFAAAYLLIHGCINIFLAIQLYRGRHWAYPATIAVLAIFFVYQIYRITLYHSTVLMIITAFDVLLAVLIWHEYRYRVRTRSAA